MQLRLNRRDVLGMAAGAAAGGMLPRWLDAADVRGAGRVEGWPEAAQAGEAMLAAGGNAVDAIVTAALVAGVVAPQMCGPGGYGGHAIFALENGRRLTAIDFNTAAPAAFREDIFPLDESGKVKGQINEIGWLAAGVPGTLAGLQLALDRFGTVGFARAAEPAIRLARDGFPVGTSLARAIRSNRARLKRYPATAQWLMPEGEPPKEGATFRNPDLAAMLEKLAAAGSVEPFYRGEIAERIADAFQKNGGLVTVADLAAYQAREVRPLAFEWNGCSIRTPPPTAGGLTTLEALAILKALGWSEWDAESDRAKRAVLEALRAAWRDRLRWLGDPEKADVPTARLLSVQHVKQLAEEVSHALNSGRPIAAETDGRPAGGTIHLSAADANGNFAALTLTHGGSFGAQVTVPGLGLVLGHGMSRFEPRPGHPNSPGPGKRPLHNMCPTTVLRDGKPVIAVGGRGGRKIPNALFVVLAEIVGRKQSPTAGLAEPRLHTDGGLDLQLEPSWSDADEALFRSVGYTITRSPHATVSAVWRETDGKWQSGSR